MDEEWLVHKQRTKYSDSLGPLPISYTEIQKQKVIAICSGANIIEIASDCRFPDWLGYLGLVVDHMQSESNTYLALSSSWALQLSELVDPVQPIHSRLISIAGGNGVLNIKDLEECEKGIKQRR